MKLVNRLISSKMLPVVFLYMVLEEGNSGVSDKGNLFVGEPLALQERNDISSEISRLKEEIERLERKIDSLERRSHHPAPFKKYPRVTQLPGSDRKRILVTGGAGFVGSHLVDRLMRDGHEVTVADNLYTGSKRNIEHWLGHENFEFIRHDIVNPLMIEVDEVYHLASPASPPHYMANPVKTIKTNTLGTINMLGLAKRVNAKILLASTSEIYGDPSEHPQSENYWGNVNPAGPRSCYDEGKRIAESLMYSYHQQEKVDVRVARIFNTYGPRMHLNDGRVVSNFISQSLQNKSITIYGSGDQTRSFQYVSDLIRGLIALMDSNVTSPVNLGNTEEFTIAQIATIIKSCVNNSNSDIVYLKKVVDDPTRRKPDVTKARNLLHWIPLIPFRDGLKDTVRKIIFIDQSFLHSTPYFRLISISPFFSSTSLSTISLPLLLF